jgi:nucleoside phosphorylase
MCCSCWACLVGALEPPWGSRYARRWVAVGNQSSTRIHVLVITALRDELDGVKAIEDGAVGSWEERQDGAGFRYHVREFEHASGRIMRVAVARPVDMGPMPASNIATRLVNELDPVCLAMSGICAGRRGDVFLGDVVVASRLFDYEAGKTKVSTNAAGERVEDKFHKITTYNLDARWQQRAQDWDPEWRKRWQAQRPLTLTWQEEWLLDALRRHEQGQGEKPDAHPERKTHCPSWKDVILRLRKRGLLAASGLALTEAGRAHVDEQWLLHDGRMPEDPPLRVHVAPMATGSQVVQDPGIFDRLSRLNRKLVALDMEGVAIGQVAALERGRRALVVKAVQDYADHDKDDSLRHFGVRVAAAFVLDFLRENLPADALGPPPPALKDYLSTGQTPLRSLATPATYLVARHQIVPFVGRERELTTLDTWADSGDAVRVLLVHGPGGMGKTRLLTEWLARRAARHPGDAIGFLAGSLDDVVIDALCTSQCATVVIDYAEERAGLLTLLMRLSSVAIPTSGGPERVRLVLLARNAGDWWASLKNRSSEMADLLGEPPLDVTPLTHSGQDARMAEYRRAHAAFVQVLQRRPSSVTPASASIGTGTSMAAEPDLRAKHFERPLYVHMAALSAVLGKPQSGAPRDILDEILNHEQRYWARYLGVEPEDGQWRQRAAEIRQAVAAVVVRGSCAHDDLPLVMKAVALPDGDRICALLKDLYPDPDPALAHAWVAAIEPDLIAEALLCSVLERCARPNADHLGAKSPSTNSLPARLNNVR